MAVDFFNNCSPVGEKLLTYGLETGATCVQSEQGHLHIIITVVGSRKLESCVEM